MKAVVIATLFATLLAAAPRRARADEPPPPTAPAPPNADERAAELFERAKHATDEGKPDEARALLTEAFGLKKSWDIAANLGSVELEVSAFADAATHLTFAVAAFPASGSAEKRARLGEWLAKAKAAVGSVRVSASVEGAVIELDGKPIGKAPLAEAVFVMPGKHVFGASHTGYVAAREERTLAAGSEQALSLVLVAESKSEPGGWMGFAPGGAVLGVGIAALGIGAGLRAAAGSAADSADSTLAELRASFPNSEPCNMAANASTCATVRDDRQSHDRLSDGGLGLLIAGGAMVAAGAVLLGVAGVTAPTTVAVAPVVSTTNAGINVFGSF